MSVNGWFGFVVVADVADGVGFGADGVGVEGWLLFDGIGEGLADLERPGRGGT